MRINPRVRRRMFTTPLTVFPVSKPDSVGDVVKQEPFELLCYTHSDVKMVTSVSGIEEISTRQLYLPMDDINRIDITSKITCRDSVEARIIRKGAWDGPNSQTLIGVVYLP